MSLKGCQNNPIDVNFHLQKSLEIFDKNSADKIQSKKDKGIKVLSLTPIRVNNCLIFEHECKVCTYLCTKIVVNRVRVANVLLLIERWF